MSDNIATNKLVAYQQLVSKLDKTIRWLVRYAIISTCTALGLSAYIVMVMI